MILSAAADMLFELGITCDDALRTRELFEEVGRHRLLRRYCSMGGLPCIPGAGLVREFEIQDTFARFGFTWALG